MHPRSTHRSRFSALVHPLVTRYRYCNDLHHAPEKVEHRRAHDADEQQNPFAVIKRLPARHWLVIILGCFVNVSHHIPPSPWHLDLETLLSGNNPGLDIDQNPLGLDVKIANLDP